MSISRTLFRNGASEYAINGDVCRLLDVQELLSDSGLGREMHVIVGQGRLDSVLQASPEDRRGFIEEAAGILKHRRRKEKTLRKLEAMEANLTRLSDLAGELRRQLKPLGRQAEIAREAATIAAVVRDAKARLLADELVGLRAELAGHARSEQERHTERLVLQDQLENTRARLEQLEAQQRSEAVDEAQRVAFGLERVQERLRGLYTLAGQRLALLGERRTTTIGPGHRPSRRPRSTRPAPRSTRSREGLGSAQDAATEASREVIARARRTRRARHRHRRAERARLEARHADHRAARLGRGRGIRPRRRRGGRRRASSARSTPHSRAAPRPRRRWPESIPTSCPKARPRSTPRRTNEPSATRPTPRPRSARCASGCTPPSARSRRSPRRRRHSAAPSTSRTPPPSSSPAAAPGVRGLLGDSVKITAGYEAAIAAALGPLVEGLLVDSRDDAFATARTARDGDLGVVDIAIADAGRDACPRFPRSTASSPARDVVSAPDGVLGILSHVVIADDLDAALAAGPALAPCRRRRARSRSSPAPARSSPSTRCAPGPARDDRASSWRRSGMPQPSAAPRCRWSPTRCARRSRTPRKRWSRRGTAPRRHSRRCASTTRRLRPTPSR